MAIDFILNDRAVNARSAADTPLLWVIRDEFKLTGSKYGCGIAQCGACTVHLDGTAVRSCITPLKAVAGRAVMTIEGLDSAPGKALKQAWIDEQVPQCGYCQSGQIMQAAALLALKPRPNDDEITHAMRGNLCRCMTYTRIRRAIKLAAEQTGKVS